MTEIDQNTLFQALENASNDSIMKLTSSKIKKYKNDILQQLQLDRETLKNLHKKLKYYRYVADLSDLKEGHYIRWISLNKPDDIKLTVGAFFIDSEFTNGCVQLICKNGRRKIKVKYDEILIFQKITNQEAVILSVLDYLDK